MNSQRQDLEENGSKKRMNYSSTNIYGSKAGCRCRCSCSQDAGVFNRLPLELWMAILSLLPVKSLLVVRAVCKSFLSIIHDSRFAPLHLRRFPYNASETRFLTVQREDSSNGAMYEVRDSINGFAPIATAHINEPGLQTGEEVSWSLASSLDGLHVIISFPLNIRRVDARTVVLWNPSIRKIRQLSLPSLAIRDLALGYHPRCKDYKIVAASVCADEAWLYSVETGSWCELVNSGVHFKKGVKKMYSQSLSYNGGVLWIDCGYLNCMKYERLVLFDFGTERFRYTEEMPYSLDKCKRSGSRLVMLDGGSSVGVLGVDVQEQASVWALEMDTMSWTRRYKIAPDVLPELTWWAGIGRVRFIEKSGELAWKYWTGKSLRVLTYDTETQAIKRHQEFAGIVQDCLGVHFESLIML